MKASEERPLRWFWLIKFLLMWTAIIVGVIVTLNTKTGLGILARIWGILGQILDTVLVAGAFVVYFLSEYGGTIFKGLAWIVVPVFLVYGLTVIRDWARTVVALLMEINQKLDRQD